MPAGKASDELANPGEASSGVRSRTTARCGDPALSSTEGQHCGLISPFPLTAKTRRRRRCCRRKSACPAQFFMDPISALSIATGIVTFADFGTKLLKLYGEV